MLHIIGDIDLTEGYFDKGLGIGNSLVDKKEDPFNTFPGGTTICGSGILNVSVPTFRRRVLRSLLIPVIWNTSAISIVTASRTTMSCSLEMKLTGKWRLTFVGKE